VGRARAELIHPAESVIHPRSSIQTQPSRRSPAEEGQIRTAPSRSAADCRWRALAPLAATSRFPGAHALRPHARSGTRRRPSSSGGRRRRPIRYYKCAGSWRVPSPCRPLLPAGPYFHPCPFLRSRLVWRRAARHGASAAPGVARGGCRLRCGRGRRRLRGRGGGHGPGEADGGHDDRRRRRVHGGRQVHVPSFPWRLAM
jgi:hypothetical protein